MNNELDELLNINKSENTEKLNDFLEVTTTKNPSKIGKLQSNISGTIHSKHAATLIQGKIIENSKKSRETTQRVIGLYRFATATATIESNIKKDDPFADFVFYHLHEEIILARKELKEKVSYFKNWIKGSVPSNLTLTDAINLVPLKMDFKFNSVLAFQLTYLILELDEYFTLIKLAQHIALVDSAQSNTMINDNMRKARRLMNIVHQYKHSNATRNDAATNNQVWQRACESMPTIILTDEFLTGEKRSALAPFIAIRPESQTQEDVEIPEKAEVS
jgi:integrating conjugative element protein (TIGR03761 family)